MANGTTDNELHTIRLCVDKQLHQGLLLEAAERAIEENPENAPSADLDAERKVGVPPSAQARETFGAVLTGKKWANGRVLRVRHLAGDPAIHERVEQVARQWEAFANITFSFVDDENAEIRISYLLDNESWSYVGTDALTLPMNEETMHYGWLETDIPDEELQRVVLHEFGHALGMIHEHQHPSVVINWNKDVVYSAYRLKGWSKAMVDSNLFAPIQAHETQFDAYDPQSIMHYPVAAEFTTDGKAVGWNRKLSDGDKKFITRVYPKVAAPAGAFPPPGVAADVGAQQPGGDGVRINWR